MLAPGRLSKRQTDIRGMKILGQSNGRLGLGVNTPKRGVAPTPVLVSMGWNVYEKHVGPHADDEAYRFCIDCHQPIQIMVLLENVGKCIYSSLSHALAVAAVSASLFGWRSCLRPLASNLTA